MHGAGLSTLFRRVGFEDLPGWVADDHAAAFSAFRLSAVRYLEKPWKTGSLGVRLEAFEPAFAAARNFHPQSREEARRFFEDHFVPHRITPADGSQGFVTGYYEPVVQASSSRTDRFTVPLYARPADLADVDETNRPSGMDPYLAFARATPDGLAEYPDRAAIEQGELAGQELEMAWLESAVDAFFIHVQGAARLMMTDGSTRRITYAAKSGQRFTGPGGILVAMGEIPRDIISMQAIRDWFASNPDRINEILWQNRSFIFFRDAPVDDPHLGPIAAAKVPLTPGRSVAVDRLLHTFATPFYINAPDMKRFGDAPFRRLMIAQDTGSAITGPARGDLFAGSGDAAGHIAGAIRHEADFFALLPKGLI